MRKKTLLLSLAIVFSAFIYAQKDTTDLLKELQNDAPKQTSVATAAFKTTRIVSGQSIENLPAGVLDLRFNHRFGRLNTGIKNLFGLDEAFVRIGLEYGITNRLMAGIGRSSIGKEFDGFLKYKLLRQSAGEKNIPVSISLLGSAVINTSEYEDIARNKTYNSRFYFTGQLLIARKFNESLTLQVTPSYTYAEVPTLISDPQSLFAIGIGGRHKISKRVSINAEYYYQLPGSKFEGTTDALSFGVDIETGGHVFQLLFSNSRLMNEKAYLHENTGDWGNGDIHFGFNLSRVFTVKKPKNIN